MKKLALFFLSIVVSLNSLAQDAQVTKSAIKELQEFIAIPNFGLNEKDIESNISWLAEKFTERGFQTQHLSTSGNPLLFAEMRIDKDLPTVLFYMHLDGQAVDPSRWDQSDPYAAVIKKKDAEGDWATVADWEGSQLDEEWRIFGRSASDDKGPIIAFLHTIDILESKSVTPRFNIKVILDAEEELGSKPLAAAVKKYRDLLIADALVINDGPTHLSGHPTLNFGCRGIMTLNMTTYGPVKPQHSGHYGNYAPNPVFRLAHLLSSMKDDEGRVLVKGYYDGITLSPDTKTTLALVPDDVDKIHNLLQIKTPEKVGANYQEALQYPSLNARGISSAWVGAQARTIVPDNATVAIDIRLVPESHPDSLIKAIKAHVKAQGFHIVDHEPTYEERKAHNKLLYLYASSATLPFRTEMNTPTGRWLEGVVSNTFNVEPIKVRIMGGTVPIAAFINELNIPAVIVPMVNPNNNQHSPNENLRIGHLNYAIQLFEGIMKSEPRL